MWSSSVLDRVCIYSQLMDLAKQESVAVFGPEHFSVQVPALIAHVVITARSSCCLAGWHPQSATRTDSFLQYRHRLRLGMKRVYYWAAAIIVAYFQRTRPRINGKDKGAIMQTQSRIED